MRFWDCDLPRAELDFQANLHMAQQHGFPSIAALCHLVLGAIATARHQLDAAEAHFHQVLTDLHIENARFAMLAVCRLIDIYAFQGHPESARPIVERFKEHAALVGVSYLHDYTHAVDASLAMACGDLPRALGWALRGSDDRPSYTSSDRLPIVRARILLAEKSPASLHKASQILLKFIRYLESQNRRCYLVEACGLQALALAELGQREHALAELGKAVHLAVPNGMVGHFIQLGQPMRQLLHALSMQAEYAQSAELLLAAFPVASPNSVAAHTPTAELPESLTDRECDVLRLMAAGLSNKEIAQQLVISAHTVRNHTANIFGKLQVDSRLQAVDRARLLGLLPQGPSNGLRHN
jgi:LuxR family maltose regulon positive regulatory protein